MYYYRAYGLNYESDSAIDAFTPIEKNNQVDLTIRFEQSPDYVIEEKRTSKKCYGKSGDVFWFTNKYATFTMEYGRKIIVDTDIHQHTSGLFVLGYCMSIIFYQRGKIAMHGSGVSYKGKTFIIAGHSGAGKSSLTSCFLDDGARFMVDDISAISLEEGRPKLTPGFPNQHLCKDLMLENGYDIESAIEIDEGREKYRYSRVDSFDGKARDLDVIVYLEPYKGSEVKVKELDEIERLKYFLKHIFSRRILGRMGLSKWVMWDAISIAKNTKAIRIRRPIGAMTVEKQRSEILKKIMH